jgi:RecA-family ATPase
MTPDITSLRVTLRDNGYTPLPLFGKEPPAYGKNNNTKGFSGWQLLRNVNRSQIEMWGRLWQDAENTGILCRDTPALDVDIYHEEAAVAVEALVKERFEERGYCPVRIGFPPKRAFLFQTDIPFDKIPVNFVQTRSKPEKVEFLCNGQQLAVHGIHPDTGRPYNWFDGEPWTIKREELPYISAEEAQQLVNDVVELLVRDFGYARKADRPKRAKGGNGQVLNDQLANEQDWQYLIANILKGDDLHDSLRDLAAKLIASGMGAGAAVNQLRALMESSTAPHDDRWQERFDDIPRAVQSAVESGFAPEPEEEEEEQQPPPPGAGGQTAGSQSGQVRSQQQGPQQGPQPLPYVDIAARLEPIPWLIPERIPMRNVTLLSGEGSIGKSTLLMQLLGATALSGGQWLGAWPDNGPCLYLTAEEEDPIVRFRLEAVADSLGTTRQRLKDNGLKVLSFAGRDAVLGQPDRSGFIRPTPLFTRLREDILQLKPKLIGIDAAADVFAGNEINRAQTRQFITMLRGLAIDADSTVILVAHPSLQGITSDTGLSGNTAWHNSVRARMYFKRAPGNDKALRVLEVKKNNYGPEQENILLRWQDGVYVVVPGENAIERVTEDARVDDLFLKLLQRFAEQGRNVSHNTGRTYAPSRFADDPEAQATKTTGKHFAAAMERLFTAKKIRAKEEGRPSHKTYRLVVVPGDETGQRPANAQPTPANAQEGGGGVHPPITP